ncbi:MAG TPA: AMP-binding protein [Actinophytocola sp.]|uniref:AMP-binding protein n=1 Tax=Actinophytocola sp. TaxID=1872138 RepID=UPI002DDD83E4|nr:AMP-binding protein [Actinophytocola sp.]HEV2779287.1 AMP-binding protein [Actinophytocola sp.]
MTKAAPTAERQEAGAGHLFVALDRWSERTPTSIAVSAPDGSLDFRELARRTRAIAGSLAAAGVGRGSTVGLANGRSRLSVPSWLAVWWLGATAVPVDDRFPADRLNFVLRDAGVDVLLADRIHPDAVPPGVRRIPPGASGATVAPVEVGGDDCAYLIYTSGTTGRPKGVEITYRGLGTFLSALAGIGLTPGGMGVNPLSPGFDGWLWCTLLYLLHGQGLAIIDLADGDAEHADLAARIAAVRPRTVCLTPSLLASCVDALSTVDVVVVAGEPCPRGLAERLAGGRRVLNVYGPTETTIAATWADNARGDDVLTIGRPLPGYQTHVLDEHGVPARAGELYIGGPAVARGYRNRPGLTAERFVPGPLGDRLYRTGDLVSIRSDGLLEYVGRRDEQVKVRGFRVELREVELVAEELETVTAAAAYVPDPGQTIGLAVVPAPGRTADPAAIRDHCRNRLPDFMVPAGIDVVAALPATANGKVDRAALARRAAGGRPAAGRAPATTRELEVCAAWSEVLDRPVADVDADFFELGGHSLLAAMAVSALRERTGIRLSMQTLLAHPTPAELAAELDRLAGGAGTGLPVAGRSAGGWLVPWSAVPAERPTVLCVPPAGSGCGRYRAWQEVLGDDFSVVGVQLPGRENRLGEPHPSTLDEMVSAITAQVLDVVKPDQPLLVFGESYGGLIGYEITRRLGEHGRWPAALVLAACEPPQLRDAPEGLVEHARHGMLETGIDHDTRAQVLDLVRRDVELIRDYRAPADPRVDAAVHVWGADRDDTASPERLDAWPEYLGMPVHRRRFEGSHVFVTEQAAVIPRLLGEILGGRRVPLPGPRRAGAVPC